MSYLVRLVLPDRPGALGAVATALGGVGADILSVDVIERGEGSATDDLVIDLPRDRLPDSLVSAAATVAGVRVESIRRYADRLDAYNELALLDSLAGQPSQSLPLLAEGVARIFRADWALVLAAPVDGRAVVFAGGGAAPEIDAVAVPWWPPRPSRQLDPDPAWAPPDWQRVGTELAVAPLGEGALLVGRPALHWLASELLRLQHLAGIAATVTG